MVQRVIGIVGMVIIRLVVIIPRVKVDWRVFIHHRIIIITLIPIRSDAECLDAVGVILADSVGSIVVSIIILI